MEYNELLENVCECINEIMPDATSRITTTVKNNGVVLSGLSISKEGVNAAPTIYMENYYQDYLNGMDIEDIAQKVIEIYRNTIPGKNIDFDFFENYDEVKKRIYIKLINKERNDKLLESVPYELFFDLAIVCYCKISNDEIGEGSILIRNEHLKMWNIEKEQLLCDAKNNSETNINMQIRGIGDVLSDMNADLECELGDIDMNEANRLFVVNSQDGYFGAMHMAIPSCLKEMANKLAGDFFIIPSSIFELLILPKEDGDFDSLKKMIREVNASYVNREEVLSDHAYYYNTEEETLIF